jgi:2-desacetyl-2-hydroxyethyl bacteriochlorophyllide A dehydrogenase
MGQVTVFAQPRTLTFADYPDPPLGPREVRLKTLFSGISTGTELTAYRGSNPYIHKRWDADQRLFIKTDQPSQQYPLSGWGYEEVGEIVETGPQVNQVKVGEVVYGTWGHKTHHVVDEEYASTRRLPAGLEPVQGIFSHIGAIALNGILDAAIRISETVAIFGLGVPGQITAQLAKKSGARVIGVDPLQSRLDLALELGAIDVKLDPQDGSPAERIKALTQGRGADVCIEVSGFHGALNEAIRAVAYSSRVVALGFFQGEAQGLYLGEEYHHNRIDLLCSQISGISPELSHRWNRLRLVQTTMALQAQGVLNLRPLISHVFPFSEAADAFALLDNTPEKALQVVLAF